MTSAGPSQDVTSPAISMVALATLAWCCAGCATGRYRAADLPADYLAPPPVNAQTIDLSRLGTPAASSELIDRGDVLEVSIAAGLSDDDTVTFPVRVDDRGRASLPIIGDVPLAGLELEGAESSIAAACIHGGLYRAPHVTVTMKQQRLNRVTVIGAVKEPGMYSLPRANSDLLAALVAAGGLTEEAGANVEIKNRASSMNFGSSPNPIAMMGGYSITETGHTVANPAAQGASNIRVNLVAAVKQGSSGYYVSDGGIVMVDRRDPQAVNVIGLVKKPGSYDFPLGKQLTLLNAIALAEGLASTVADKVIVIRQPVNGDKPIVIQCSLRAAKNDDNANLRLAPGDTVSVEQTPATVLLDAFRLINFGFGASLGTLF